MPSLKKSLNFYSDDVPGACSLSTIYWFDPPRAYINRSSFIPPSKTGLYVVMFTDKAPSKEMYYALREIMDIEYQSKPTMGNEGHLVFVCIFKERK